MASTAEIYEFVSDPRNKLAVFGSIGPTGPQSAVVGIGVTPELEIVFDTLSKTRKYANIQADPRCSFAIGVGNEITVQYEGVACVVTDPAELLRLKKVYFAAFPDGPSRESWPGITYIAVTPKWIRYCDYGDTPPRIEETRF